MSWDPVSHGDITATMTYDDTLPTPTGTVRVTLTGPTASSLQIKSSDKSGNIEKLTPLPQVFELVGKGKDSDNSDIVVKYGFELKQWFINRGNNTGNYSQALQWCKSIGYRMVKVKDLTNASCNKYHIKDCSLAVDETPSSPEVHYQRRIGAGLSAEWGRMHYYADAGFIPYYWADGITDKYQFAVSLLEGYFGDSTSNETGGIGIVCVSP